ncbi:MAG TPA: SPOR domain-containing protein [Thermoanaerobaculales bacterium]|nr:SPOR domain-containing protein [Thermoanaerobaculales bacterium]HQL30984.1 SPOR domain-containing protein [Thermoanaerobaculales bacterium]HQN97283.1 SPOR domain-containing protein [Thermoanaerobaculales bacterium]
MAPSYYVIELTARWLAALLVALALVMILAFVFGYGAAWSVLEHEARPAQPAAAAVAAGTPTPTPVELRVAPADPAPAATAWPLATATPEPVPTAAPEPEPEPTATTRPRPTEPPVETASGYWVQVLASSSPDTVAKAQATLQKQGFGADRQLVVRGEDGQGNELIKLRVGPFPDHASADRVAKRMQGSGFSGAWVVAP